MTNLPKISNIILTLNNVNSAYRCIESIKAAIPKLTYNMTTYVIDLGSTKENKKKLIDMLNKGKYSELNIKAIIPLKYNQFANNQKMIGLNLALKDIKNQDYVAIFEDNVKVGETFFTDQLKTFEETIDVDGIIGYCSNTFDLLTTDKLTMKHISKTYEGEKAYNEVLFDEKELNSAKWFSNFFCGIFKYDLFKDQNFDESCLDNGQILEFFDKNKDKKFILTKRSYVRRLLENKIIYDTELSMKMKEIKAQLNAFDKPIIYTFTNELAKLPKFESDKYAYVCFTEINDSQNMNGWKVVRFDLTNHNKEFVKYLPHYFFKSSNYSCWIDESCLSNKLDFAKFFRLKKNSLICLDSDCSDCAYLEVFKLLEDGRMNEDLKTYVISYLQWHNYPVHAGYADLNILIRNHSSKHIQSLCEKMYNCMSHFDLYDNDLFFNFILWLNKKSYFAIPKILFDNQL